MGTAAFVDDTEQEHAADALVAEVGASRVLDLAGKPLRLRELWTGGPVVHVFLRQFGCLFCQRAVSATLELAPQILPRGRIVLVGCGTPEQAQRFAASRDIPRPGIDVVCDPERGSYDAANLARGWARVFLHPGSALEYVKARRAGFRIKGVAGDVPQLGGTMIVRPPGKLLFLHRSSYAGDDAEASAILGVLRG